MLAFLRLIRPLNLLIMAGTMYAMRYFIMLPMLKLYKLDLLMPNLDFALLVASVLCIGAAGYIINDYFDIRADRINKNGDVIVGKLVKRRIAMASHLTLNFIGVALGVYLAWKIGMWKRCLIHIFAAGSLWYYSVMFKKELFIGNFIIAAVTAVVPMIPAMFEVPLFVQEYGPLLMKAFSALLTEYGATDFFNAFFYWTGAFAGFAFLLSFIREVQKDMADVEGDRAVGCKTIPIRFGFSAAKTITIALSVLVILLVLFVQEGFLLQYTDIDTTSRAYLYLFVAAPMVVSIILTLKAQSRQRFLLLGNLTKAVMLTGILYSIICRELLMVYSTV